MIMTVTAMTIDIKDIINNLKEHNNFYILTHQYPDGDTLGSAFALCRTLQLLGKSAKVLCPDLIANKYNYLLNGVSISNFEPEYIISVDVADKPLLGSLQDKYGDKVDMCIDHHSSNTHYAKCSYVDGDRAATAEIIFEIISQMGVSFDKNIASCIYTGISTDTGCFRYSNATPDSYRIAASMMEYGCDAAAINRIMFETKSRAKLDIERQVMDSIEYYSDNRCAIVYVTADMVRKSGISEDELDGIASIPRKIEGVLMGITMRQKSDTSFKISVRTNDNLDASKFCMRFGGGGHAAAAGCTVEGNLQEAKSLLANAAIEFIAEETTA